MSEKPRALVIKGDGISCEQETATALRMARFDVDVRDLNDLIAERLSTDELSHQYSVLALPGGMSFADCFGAGKVLTLKIVHHLRWDLTTFASRGGLVIGIGNGFQVLIRMGIFGQDISIMTGTPRKFTDTWVKVTPIGNRCVWLKGLGTIDLPLRSKEGKIILTVSRRAETLDKMNRLGTQCLKYEGNPNGSAERLAGLCDPQGRIFGIMPHPEAFTRWTAHPEWTLQPGRASASGQGLALFENAYQEVIQSR